MVLLLFFFEFGRFCLGVLVLVFFFGFVLRVAKFWLFLGEEVIGLLAELGCDV